MASISKRGATPPRRGARRWHSVQHREQARAEIRAFNAGRHLRPLCGATCRSTGEPCRDVAMANGRCFRHGGRTPSGKNWHRPRWPNADAPDAIEKLEKKLRDKARAEKKRAARLEAMTPEERQKYESWKRSHKPGPPGPRARDRAERVHAAEMRRRIEAPPAPPSAEAAELEQRIADLRRQADEIKSKRQASRGMSGVFQ